jgi:hypothetical protein
MKQTKWYSVVINDKTAFNIECTEILENENGHEFWLNDEIVAFVPYSMPYFKIETPK